MNTVPFARSACAVADSLDILGGDKWSLMAKNPYQEGSGGLRGVRGRAGRLAAMTRASSPMLPRLGATACGLRQRRYK
jgi:hypothetical protein